MAAKNGSIFPKKRISHYVFACFVHMGSKFGVLLSTRQHIYYFFGGFFVRKSEVFYVTFQEKGWICEHLWCSAKISGLAWSVTWGPSPQPRPDEWSGLNLHCSIECSSLHPLVVSRRFHEALHCCFVGRETNAAPRIAFCIAKLALESHLGSCKRHSQALIFLRFSPAFHWKFTRTFLEFYFSSGALSTG